MGGDRERMLHTTLKQKQWQLYLLGYLDKPEEIDGIWGPKSEAATLEFQKGNFPEKSTWDGIFGPMTEEKSREIIGKIQEAAEAYSGISLIKDGLAGPATLAAVKTFQQGAGFPVTGIADEKTCRELLRKMEKADEKGTGTFWDRIVYFTREEFRCQCGGKYCNGFPVEPDETMVRTVDEIRRRLGVPVRIVDAGGSGVRCKVHNTAVGGASNSLHMYGRAADLHSSASPARMKEVAEEVMGATGELGLYDWGIHVGIGKYSRFNG